MDHIINGVTGITATADSTKLTATAALFMATEALGTKEPVLRQLMRMAIINPTRNPVDTMNTSCITTLIPALRRNLGLPVHTAARAALGLAPSLGLMADGLRPSKGSWHNLPLLENHIQHFLVAPA